MNKKLFLSILLKNLFINILLAINAIIEKYNNYNNLQIRYPLNLLNNLILLIFDFISLE